MKVSNFPNDICPLCSSTLITERGVIVCPIKDNQINLIHKSHYYLYQTYQELYIYLDNMIYQFINNELRCSTNSGSGWLWTIQNIEDIDFHLNNPILFQKQLETLKNFS